MQRFSIAVKGLSVILTVMLSIGIVYGAVREQVLFSFNVKDGLLPEADLVLDGAGNLYGTTYEGGTYNQGTVFELTPSDGSWSEEVLYSFDNNGQDGYNPTAGLVFDAAGNLYGTTTAGGGSGCNGSGCGTVFELTPAGGGAWTEIILHDFQGDPDGSNPQAGLTFDTAGNLYGTASSGGIYGRGTVFELTPNGDGSWSEEVLYSFDNDGNDGSYPSAGLVFDAAGNLYGTTVYGGTCCGTVFELTPNGNGGWTEAILHNFEGNSEGTHTADGADPYGGLIFDPAGNLYGTTLYGGINNSYLCGYYGCGTVFRLRPEPGGGWSEEVLHSFNDGASDGYMTYAGLTLDTAGNLYGITKYGGTYQYGAVFGLRPKAGGGWQEGVLHSFNFNGRDGWAPMGGLISDAAGNLYGTTEAGGSHGQDGLGTVFSLTP